MMKIDIDKIFESDDREYRNYLWLAYIQKKEDQLQSLRLSPSYKEVKNLQEQFQRSIDEFKQLKLGDRDLKSIDLQNKKLNYSTNVIQADVEEWLEDLNQSYLPESAKIAQQFTALKEYIYSSTSLAPIGIESIYYNEGFVMVKYDYAPETEIYKYKVSVLSNAAERVTIYLDYITKFKHSISNGFEKVKKELNANLKFQEYYNAYLIECKVNVPLQESLIPVVKGKLHRFLISR